jgi:predicted Holliday junction resolvase-like endonuclease
MEDREGELELALMAVGLIAVCAVLSNFKLRKRVKSMQQRLERVQMNRHRISQETQRCLDQANMRVAMKMREPCTTTQEIEAVIRDENEFLDIVHNYPKKK